MPKPVCVPCQRFFRPKKNGYALVEGAPMSNDAGRLFPGIRHPAAWRPYKLWMGDLWECPDCLAQIVVGFGQHPIREDYHPDFAETAERYNATLQVNDC